MQNLTNKREHLPIEDEVWNNDGNYSIGEFLDKAPTDVLLKLLAVIKNELNQRELNFQQFMNEYKRGKYENK